jgi:hypothetical protein
MASAKCSSVKWPFREISIRGNGISAKWHFGETFFGEIA